MIRPELRAALRRWREVWLGAAIGLAGFWIAGFGGWFYLGLGVAIGAAGLGTAVVGLRRMRVPTGGAAPGVVEVVEGQIAYFAPEDGGFVALSEIESVAIADAPGPGRHWRIAQPGAPALRVPVAAKGADALFDVFASLPGARPARMLTALEAPTAQRPVTVWSRAEPAALT